MVVNILAVLLAFLSAYLGFWAVSYNVPLWWLGSIVVFVVALGLLLRKHWAQYAWYILTLLAVTAWLGSIGRVAITGWPYSSAMSTVLSLLPGALLLLVCIGGSHFVARRYHRPS